MTSTKTKSVTDNAGGPLEAPMEYLLKTLQWDGDILTVAYRFIFKKWKRRLLGVLLLIPIVYLLLVSRSSSTIDTSPPTRRIHKDINKMTLMDSLESSGHHKDFSSVKTSSLSGMIKLKWVDMKLNGTESLYTFISAYFDDRAEVPGHPAVVTMAYVQNLDVKYHLKCVFKYSNGSKMCQSRAWAREENVDCLIRVYQKREVLFKTIVCSLPNTDSIPEAVQFSSTTDCQDGTLSEEIPVGNRVIPKEEPTKKIGVCLHGSLRKPGNVETTMQQLRNFISMSLYLGAEFITMYAVPEKVDDTILKMLLANYSKVVNLVEWKPFKYDYHGQFGIVYDCLYRHMHDTKYLAFYDLDEMIIPFQHNNWLDMLDELENEWGKAYLGYSFINRMYVKSNTTRPELHKCSEIDKDSVYLTWFHERQCVFKHKERSKMILNPRKIIHPHIHRVCKATGSEKLFLVNKELAVNAHYRTKDLWICWNFFTKDRFERFRSLLDKYTNSICKSSVR